MIININELVHLPEKSVYNHNYYKGKSSNQDVELLEICHEDFNTYDFYICKGGKEIFIGSSQNFDCDGIHHVSFGEMYT